MNTKSPPYPILFRTHDNLGDICVLEHGEFRYLTFGSAYEQSSMNIHKPAQLVHEYMQAMMLVLAFIKPTQVTILGLGAGCLLRSVHDVLPELAIDAIELRQKVYDVACDYFSMPTSSRIHVHIQDAYQWVKNAEENHTHIIFADLFHKEGMNPLQAQKRFIHHCHRILQKRGWLVVNYHKMPEVDSAFYAQLTTLFDDVFVCPISSGNNILFASTYPIKILSQYNEKVQVLEKQLSVPMMSYFQKLTRLTGQARK